MSSSDSDEFFDAEEITPSKIHNSLLLKDSQKDGAETNPKQENTLQNISNPQSTSDVLPKEPLKETVDVIADRNHGRGRRKFRELRQFMQTEDDDGGQSPPSSQTSSVEGVFPTTSKTAHPFRIIEHDKISLQSLSSLGRIGRILNGSVDPSGISLGKDSQLSGGFHSSTSSDGPSTANKNQHDEDGFPTSSTVIPMQEPDVIASTKSNSLKHSQAPKYEEHNEATSQSDSAPESLVTESHPSLPVAPPRKKKKVKNEPEPNLPDPQPVQKPVFLERPERPTLKELNVKPPTLSEILNSNKNADLPSPASTIESLTREFQNSLDLSMNEKSEKVFTTSKESFGELGMLIERPNNSPIHKSEGSSRSSTIKSINSNNSDSSIKGNNSLDIKSAVKGQYVVKPQDEERAKAAGPSRVELERLENLRKAFSNNAAARNKSNSNSANTGHSSLGYDNRIPSNSSEKTSKERRKSAGDEDDKQLNMYVRTRTDSGKELTDMEILEQVTVLNLDTGERVPLSIAEEKLPQGINPLSLHIMRLTSEYISNSSLYDKQRESDEESIIGRAEGSVGEKSNRSIAGSIPEGMDENSSRLRKKTAKFKRFLGSTVKKTVNKAKSFAAEVTHSRHKEDVADIVDEVRGEQNIKLKASNSHKGPYDFDGCVRHVQEFSDHAGPVWCMKFSQCGRLLATAGQDKVLRIWVIKDAYPFFQDLRTKYDTKQKSSPTPSQESLVSSQSIKSSQDHEHPSNSKELPSAPFMSKPFCVYTGHTSDLLDVSWSKNYFVLSSSMDKTVRLWHISRKECLCCFQHIDFVTAIVFHPRDDRYFLSGSLDGKLRLWNIPDKKVAVWNEVDGQTKLITAANFCQNGKFAVVGSYDGRCIFYTTDQLKYHTQIDVRSTRGKNSTGRKISGIEPMPGEDKILVTSNDSRIRLYDLRDLSLSCKYKGYVNVSSQIKASFSHDGKYIVSGSENQCIYIWKTHHDYSKFTSVRRDRNDFWEGIKAHNAVVTCAVFAPNPENIIRMIDEREQIAKGAGPSDIDPEKIEDPMVEQHTRGCGGHVLVSADFNGCIKVFVNKTKPKHSSLPVSALT